MTPAEASQERRDAAIRRARRVDALEAGQLANFLHRLAAIVPGDVDRVLAEFDANAPKPRSTPKLHPVIFYGAADNIPAQGLVAYCQVCPGWHVRIEDGHTLADLQRLAAEHSGIES